MKKLVIAISAVLVFAACQKTVTNVDVPEVEPVLVATCFITPGMQQYSLQLSLSQPIFQDNDGQVHYVPDADVFIRSDAGSVQLTYDPTELRYKASAAALPIEEGKTYKLEVHAGSRSISASCTVPVGGVTLDTVEFFERHEGPDSDVLRIIGRWQDKPGQRDYYRFYVEDVYPADIDTAFQEVDDVMVSDADADGKRLSPYVEYYPPYEGDTVTTRSFEVYLLHTDEHYYKYHDSRLQYQGDNPFSEPSIVYTNVNGGLGCFGAYIKTLKRVSVKR